MCIINCVLTLIATLCYGCAFCSAQGVANIRPAQVVSIEDGNTVVVSVDKTKSRVRLIGINVPSQALSKQSRENLTALVRGKDVSVLLAPVQLQEGKPKLVIGKVSVGELDVGLEQIRGGLAWRSKEFEKYQTPDERVLYSDAQESAANAKRGVWGEGFSPCKDATVKTTVGSGTKPRPKDSNLPDVYGSVNVEVTVDEGGNVVSARALCGHPILQTAASQAALQSKYKPQSTRITGIIVYNFVPE